MEAAAAATGSLLHASMGSGGEGIEKKKGWCSKLVVLVYREGERDVVCMGFESRVPACMHDALCTRWGRMGDWEECGVEVWLKMRD